MTYKVFLVTKGFPFGNSESSFITAEYDHIKEKFDVTVIATEVDKQEKQTYPQNIDTIRMDTENCTWRKISSLIRFLLKKEFYLEIKDIIKTRTLTAKRIFRALMFGTAAEVFFQNFKKVAGLTSETEAIVYFYWFDYKCLGLTMHQREYLGLKIIARTHGYDLYDARELYGRQFFKEQMDRNLKRLIFAAGFAKEYYLQRYSKKDSKKYPLHRLGVSDKEITGRQRREWLPENKFLLLSCSNAIQIKRIELIAEGLSFINDREIKWVHIGNGEQFTYLKDLAKQKLESNTNITFEFLGAVPNEKVIQYYRDHYVGAFITTTSTEGGSPVSVQEALSFGVPVIATAVGELPVMVQDNGVLLPENPTAQEVAEGILRMREVYGTDIYFKMCDRSLEIFHDKFDADKNYEAMAEELLLLANEK